MNIFRRIWNKLRRRETLSKAEEQDVAVSLKEIDEGKAKRFTNADALITDLKDEMITERIERGEQAREIRDYHAHSVDELRKVARQRRIAKQNEERQKATLGYGLKPRNFKPRTAHEKRLCKLDKKPPKKLEEED